MVFCYRNLNRKGIVWSVKDTASGLVIDRASIVYLSGVKLKVSKAGRARVLRDKRKNVHAGIQGIRLKNAPRGEWLRAEYNPYKMDTFRLSGTIISLDRARYAKLTRRGLFVIL